MMMDPRKISSVYLTRTAELIGISEPATKISKTSLKFRAQESSTSRDKKQPIDLQQSLNHPHLPPLL